MKMLIHFALTLALLFNDSVFAWTHGWDTALDAQFIDFGYTVLNDAQAAFVASHYKIVSLEKCTYIKKPNTEAGILTTAQTIKKFNPKVKVLFYISMSNDALDCYQANAVFMAHPEWWLYNCAGAIIYNSAYPTIPYPDYRVAAFRNWWITIPYAGKNQPDIDGVFVDHPSQRCPSGLLGVEPACSDWTNGKKQALSALTAIAKTNNPPGEVIVNSLLMYTQTGFPADNGISYLNHSDGTMAEHVATFEVLTGQGYVNPSILQTLFDRIKQATAMGKTVVMATWPGLLKNNFNLGFPAQANGLTWTGTNAQAWRQSMLDYHTWALALYLTLAEENLWMQYQLWYNGQTQGAIPCEIAPVRDPNTKCPNPTAAEWYPNLFKPLGPPLGPYTKVGNIYTRKFLYATSTLNIDNPLQSTVIFTTPPPPVEPTTCFPESTNPSSQTQASCLITNCQNGDSSLAKTFDDTTWLTSIQKATIAETSIKLCQVLAEGIQWFAGYQITYLTTTSTTTIMPYQGLPDNAAFVTCSTRSISGQITQVEVQSQRSSITNTLGINYLKFTTILGATYTTGTDLTTAKKTKLSLTRNLIGFSGSTGAKFIQKLSVLEKGIPCSYQSTKLAQTAFSCCQIFFSKYAPLTTFLPFIES